jgi:DNA polymerase III subunit gamma/tau
MSYLVLARKYRPMFFDDVVGQQHVTLTLKNAILQKRIANAYLFSGPRGVGKTTIARILAKALNCEQGPTVTPCNQCSSCVEINESRSLDVFEIDGASNRGIDEVRNLREGLRYAPSPGKYRIYIIDEVHMLTNEAFNALLKTLEEPPPNVLFVFATTESHKVPATILSRCQRFDFKRMPVKNIMAQLSDMCQKEGIQIDEESLRLIAVKADGSMRDSQSVLDQIIAYAGESINAKAVANLLGIIDQNLFFEVTDLIQAGDVLGGIQLANRIFAEGYDFTDFILGLQDHLRNFLVVVSTGSGQEIDASEDYIQRYLAQKTCFTVEDLLRLIKVCADTENLVRRSANARLHLEVSLVKMIKLNRSVQLSQIIEQLGQVKKNSNTAEPVAPTRQAPVVPPLNKSTAAPPSPPKPVVAAPPAAETTTPETPPPFSIQELEQRWPQITEAIKKKKIALGSILSEGWPTGLDGNRLEISFPPQNGFHISTIDNNREQVQTLLHEALGVRLRVHCLRDETGRVTSARSPLLPADRKSEFDKLAESNEMVKKIIDTFDADFIK